MGAGPFVPANRSPLGDEEKAEQKRRNIRLIAPVTRFLYGAGSLAGRDTVMSLERTLVVWWAVEADRTCLFPGHLPPVWPHWVQRLGAQSHDVVFRVARVTTALAILSHLVATVQRSLVIFVLAPAVTYIFHRFGVQTLAQGDLIMANSRRLLLNVEALVPWVDVHRCLPYGATASRQVPFMLSRLRETALDDCRDFIHVVPDVSAAFR